MGDGVIGVQASMGPVMFFLSVVVLRNYQLGTNPVAVRYQSIRCTGMYITVASPPIESAGGSRPREPQKKSPKSGDHALKSSLPGSPSRCRHGALGVVHSGEALSQWGFPGSGMCMCGISGASPDS